MKRTILICTFGFFLSNILLIGQSLEITSDTFPIAPSRLVELDNYAQIIL